MKRKQRHHGLSAAGCRAIATALVGASLSAKADESASRPAPNWGVETSSTNDVGCIKTTVARPHEPGQSRLSAFLYSRPPELNIESLSEDQLKSCGLPSRRGLGGASVTSPQYKRWLAEAHARLTAKQVLPWQETPLRPGEVEMPPPPLSGGRPPFPAEMLRHSSFERNSVQPGTGQTSDLYKPSTLVYLFGT